MPLRPMLLCFCASYVFRQAQRDLTALTELRLNIYRIYICIYTYIWLPVEMLVVTTCNLRLSCLNPHTLSSLCWTTGLCVLLCVSVLLLFLLSLYAEPIICTLRSTDRKLMYSFVWNCSLKLKISNNENKKRHKSSLYYLQFEH